MSTNAGHDDGSDVNGRIATRPATTPESEARRLEQLRGYLDGLDGVTATWGDAVACTALGCRRADAPLWHIDVEGGRNRTLCPTHAVAFVETEGDIDV